ncbi:MAG: ABC transporter permease [Chloroflexota bacterium]|nr:MAG: ABC transporter permease [Chloroflexota bacterium]
MTEFFNIFDATLLNSTFRFVTPILLAALGGLICERVGVFNIALEGLMLTGAFAAVVGSYYAGSAVGGVLTAVVAGVALAAIFAYFAVTLRGDMIVLGIALNLLASGLTVFMLRTIFGVKGAFQDPALQGLGKIDLPGLEALPILGPLLSGHSWVIYLSWLLVAAMQLLLFHHALGLRMRGVGEHPEAAATLGVSVAGLRYLAVLLSGALCGLAGAQLSLGNVTLFVENMSAGRGWIAVVAVMFGQAHPLGVLAASLLFGLADSIGFRLQGLQMPSQFTGMVPYVVTLVSLFIIEAQRRRKATVS